MKKEDINALISVVVLTLLVIISFYLIVLVWVVSN